VEEFFDFYLQELQSLGPSGVHQVHDCATGAVQQQTRLNMEVAEANQYQDYMQAMEFNVNMSAYLSAPLMLPRKGMSIPASGAAEGYPLFPVPFLSPAAFANSIIFISSFIHVCARLHRLFFCFLRWSLEHTARARKLPRTLPSCAPHDGAGAHAAAFVRHGHSGCYGPKTRGFFREPQCRPTRARGPKSPTAQHWPPVYSPWESLPIAPIHGSNARAVQVSRGELI
jgi:hypothetical protein